MSSSSALADSRPGTRDTDGVATWPLGDADLEAALAWLQDDRNARWLDFGASMPVMTAVGLKLMMRRDEHCLWVYGPPDDHTPAGLVALGNIQGRFRTAEAWCVLGEKELGAMDLTVRAVSRLVRHGFEELDLRCVYAWTVESNRGGRRLLERLGFRFAGSLRESHRIDERTYDRLWFDLLPEEFDGYESHESRR